LGFWGKGMQPSLIYFVYWRRREFDTITPYRRRFFPMVGRMTTAQLDRNLAVDGSATAHLLGPNQIEAD